MIRIVITILWISNLFTSLYVNTRKNKNYIPSTPWWMVLVTLNSFTLVISLLFSDEQNLSLVAFGTVLLIAGWNLTYGYNYQLSNAPLARLHRFINSFLKCPYTPVTKMVGDWVQLIGFSVIWNSVLGLVTTVILIIPIYIFTLIYFNIGRIRRQPVKKEIKRLISITSLVFRILLFGFVPAFLFLIITRDFQIFWGNESDAISLISLLLQIEVTIGALVFAILVLLIEVTTSSYTGRLSTILRKLPGSKQLPLIIFFSMATKLIILSNSSFLGVDSITRENVFLVDAVILLFVLVNISYYKLAQDSIRLLAPEELVMEIVKDLDGYWLETIKDGWSTSDGPRFYYESEDPLIQIERILLAALEKIDLTSFQTTLDILYEKFHSIENRPEGSILDNYLVHRFTNVIAVAAERRNKQALEAILVYTQDLTVPSPEALQRSNWFYHKPPLGTRIARSVLEYSIANGLFEPARGAVDVIEERGSKALHILPDYQDLWSNHKDNWQKRDAPNEEINRMTKNDRIVDGFIDGYISYIGRMGERAVGKNFGEISGLLSSRLNSLIEKFVGTITEEEYQSLLILAAVRAFNRIAHSARKNRVRNAVSFAIVTGSIDKELTERSSELVAQALYESLKGFARAGILTLSDVWDYEALYRRMSFRFPMAGMVLLEGYGNAGEELNSYIERSPHDDEALFIKSQMAYQAEHLENNLLSYGYKTKARKLGAKVRRQIKGKSK